MPTLWISFAHSEWRGVCEIYFPMRGKLMEQVVGVVPTWVLGFVAGLGGLAAGCAADQGGLFSGESGDASSGRAGSGSSGAAGGGVNSGGSNAGGSDAGGTDAGGANSGGSNAGGSSGGTGPDPGVSAASLLALTENCRVVGGQFSSDWSTSSDIPVCGLEGAVFFHADMDIDCDGRVTPECNEQTDPYFFDATAMGEHIAAAELPFVVLPQPSERFDPSEFGLELGNVVAVIYQGEVRYGAYVDIGPAEIIGEASYAMAELFGIDPDPATGGAEEGVTYIAFTGANARVPEDDILDHGRAVSIGRAQAAELVADN